MKRISKNRTVTYVWVYLTVLFLLVSSLCGCALNGQENTTIRKQSGSLHSDSQDADDWEVDKEPLQTTQEVVSDQAQIYVHVCGAVKNPGVYALAQGARVVDAITAAGGFRKKADEISLNQAEVVSDGQRLYVPAKNETAKTETGNNGVSDGSLQDTRVNLNQATKEQLMTLPGIGEAKASMIVQYREEQGAFTSIEDIMKIEGIKEGVFSKIKDYITVG